MEITRIEVRGTNCYLVAGNGAALLVDPGPPGSAGRIIRGAMTAGIDPAAIGLILVTHGHLDHYGGVDGVTSWCGAPVASHRSAPAYSRDRRNALPPAQTLRGSLVRWIYLRLSPLIDFAPLQADLLLDDESDLAPFGIDARTLLLPGHSPDSVVVLTVEGDALVGDLYVNYTVPSEPIYLANREAWERSHACLRALHPQRVHVGHGEPFAGRQLGRIYPARYQLRWWVR